MTKKTHSGLSRREFLKLASILPASYWLRKQGNYSTSETKNSDKQNILIIVFDAWSATNVSLYGYPRDTTPMINDLSKNAIVYHNHYAAAPWTVPGTGSLLTGAYPWTHRSFLNSTVSDRYKSNNLFGYFEHDYYTFGYSHNPFVEKYLTNMNHEIDEHIPIETLYLNKDPFFPSVFKSDHDAFNLARYLTYFGEDEINNSLLLSKYFKVYKQKFYEKVTESYDNQFSNRTPSISGPRR